MKGADFVVRINKASSKPYYEQLVLSIKEDILNGVLTAGDQVPSVREMAKHLLMNPNTVSKAYKVLENEQVLVTIKGKGTFVKVTEDLPRDEIRILQVKERLKELVIEARHLQISMRELSDWMNGFEQELGGDPQ
ncbi:transcriptional regulator, GntR family [Enterococcus casseliflavus 14-MB-W-14]|jgi:GntR family transcriptional regulator|uniref:GntR family transcriptional regulator n=1 Tax=Enterococcus casseliflavus TaxID=37734 RepID=A0A415EUT0_ENTCA|nr:GntR family transcriptional regulator [Enterococcus casseliflavus]EPH65712.1 transcriptional regulator, GntR family [Enterococcus casseliflavus 14-MB-W-14]HCO73003.1 GntR family transcriptional regulator [Enterococcus sp.]AYJ45159.1 GntR family transcriptional regulator [Enterococcus casseliflavus]MBE6169883.1 GntR family transcriptional regulator [Enterococcus casseliflavus]MBO6348740.1 GntR family transcriptional regulator [Enterococcus casseliflavus]